MNIRHFFDIFIKKYFKYVILALLLYIPIFGQLTALPIHVWDEARLATNAYEMSKNGNYIVTYCQGNPDMWNTKPPFMIWLQVFFMKIIGVNELAVRLPSAFATLGICLLFVFFFSKYIKKFSLGFIAVLVFLTSSGFINSHISRTGDYDALLTFFIFSFSLSFFLYYYYKKEKFLYLFFVFLTLSVLTKGVTALMIIPAIILFAFFEKELFPLLKNKHFYFGSFIFISTVLGYYFLREHYNPGYLKMVQENELGGRFLVSQLGEKTCFWQYYYKLLDTRFNIWFSFLPFGLIVGLISKDRIVKKFTLYLVLLILVFFIVISSARTKYDWYDAPLFPLMSVIVALLINYFYEKIKVYKLQYNSSIFASIFLILVFFNPYYSIAIKNLDSKKLATDGDNNIFYAEYYLKNAIKNKVDLNNSLFIYDDYGLHYEFYINVLKDKNVNIEFAEDDKSVNIGEIVIGCQESIRNQIYNKYNVVEIDRYHNVFSCRIVSKK